ncbi:acetyltransferase [Oceanisphaera avium]|uniref:Acetyltransferase n=2 Tax=Oceanisphaera avium TaxID=1903694 RepID=A0A1Y0D0K1_9GAMM|nr:acetyltransferase [Oceanisphaera avium]
MTATNASIFSRMRAGGVIEHRDPEMKKVWQKIARTIKLSAALNSATDVKQIRGRLSEIINVDIDASTIIFTPFYTNFGQHIRLGRHVFINHDCSFLDMGGITIEDNVQIGPKVSLITENHPLTARDRKNLVLQSILIKRNAWLGAGVTVLPGVIIGENAVVAAGAVVTQSVAANTLVAGVPAKVIKYLEESH